MPPKVTDTRPSAETLHRVEEATAASARRIVASYAEDLLDGVTLMSMLGVEPEGLVHKLVAEEQAAAAPKKAPAKRTRKTTKKTAAKKTTKKTTAKKTTKKTTKKAAAKKTTTKKTTAKKTAAKKS
ncbi:hypothetical protein ACUY3K_10135 [Corynebacterium uberis]|uniref:hypothetical protein n=1 Tax=Corynebacterium TaxID=1716 RepID=UPI001D0ADDB8|nr:hypothetical protein [Corynebacterium uberis]MCZ9309815.1 hypothetical protein [Corynebacterium sp. c6VSa_13]UDL73613.1 hypothetical protein LH391_11150 [Corynebacterium uberis]UDL75507.1 hypothetical protein LH393_09775 [Corynebacterium uberis]UDL77720.1 hypothetical protein LH394_09760 [Corynebacterium uberis]UDL80004.1 hypothetical protein LH392_10185 [Corynebacterium uberis]